MLPQTPQSKAPLTTGLVQRLQPQDQADQASESIENVAPHESRFQANLAVVPVQQKVSASETTSDKKTKQVNHTSLPGNLKAGLEQLSRIDMSDVQVHYNSQKPAQLNALAYTQGTDIHLSPGEEHHLPHEAWHVVQQKQGRVKPTIQVRGQAVNDNAQLEREADEAGEKAIAQPTSGSGAVESEDSLLPNVIQRNAGDEILVEALEGDIKLAQDGYDLLLHQVEVAQKQAVLIEAYSASILDRRPEDIQDPQLRVQFRLAKDKITDTAERVRTGVANFPEEAEDAWASVIGLKSFASIATPHELLVQWATESVKHVGVVARTQAKAAAFLLTMKNQAINIAKLALQQNEVHMMRALLKSADTLDEELQEGDRKVSELKGLDRVTSSKKSQLGLANTIGDATNNAVTGVGFGVVGALDAGTGFSLSSSLASNLGIAGGVLGIFFGAIGTILGVKNAILGAQKKQALKDAKTTLSQENEEIEDITDFAIDQKGKKVTRNAAAAVGGLVAVGAGVIGLVALSVSTLGIASIVAGIAAGLIGLGFLGYRAIKRWQKRKRERTEFADELITQIQTNGENVDQAKQIVAEVGLDIDQVGEVRFRKDLISKIGGYVKSQRTKMAEGLVRALIDGKPSEVFDAEIVLQALGIDPEKIRNKVEANKVNGAVDKVAGKLASW